MTTDTDKNIPLDVIDQVRSIYSETKRIKIEIIKIKKEVGAEKAHPIWGEHKIKGFSPLKKAYEEQFNLIPKHDLQISYYFLYAITNEEIELKNKIIDFISYQKELDEKLAEYNIIEVELNNKADGHIKMLTNGEISAAEIIEQERLAKLQKITIEKDSVANKITSAAQAQSLMQIELDVCREIKAFAKNNLLELRYQAEKTRFDKLLSIFRNDYEFIDKIAQMRWGNDLEKREHRKQLLELINVSKNIDEAFRVGLLNGLMDDELNRVPALL